MSALRISWLSTGSAGGSCALVDVRNGVQPPLDYRAAAVSRCRELGRVILTFGHLMVKNSVHRTSSAGLTPGKSPNSTATYSVLLIEPEPFNFEPNKRRHGVASALDLDHFAISENFPVKFDLFDQRDSRMRKLLQLHSFCFCSVVFCTSHDCVISGRWDKNFLDSLKSHTSCTIVDMTAEIT